MSLLVRHTYDGEILHCTATGRMNGGDNLTMWEHVQKLAHDHNAKKILIECAASCGRISMAHCFDLIERIPFMSRNLTCRVALFEKYMEEEARDLLRFIETSVTDRGAQFKLFFELEEAKLWLRQ